MNCNKCKKPITTDSNYCPNCGAKLEKVSNIAGDSNKKSTHINPLIIIVLAGIFAIIAVIIILESNEPEQKILDNTSQQLPEISSKIELIENSLKNDPDNIGLNIEMGNNLFDVKQYEKAIFYYKKALNLSPKNVEVRIDLAVSYYNLQIVDTALVEIDHALKLNPNHQQGLYNRGVMYYNIGDKEKAKESWLKLIELHDGTQAAETAKQLLKNI